MAIEYSPSHAFTRRMLKCTTLFSVLSILCIVSYLLVREYRSTEQDATRSALNIVQLIDRDVRNTFTIYDSTLISLIELLQSKALTALPPTVQHSVLFDRANEAPSNNGFYVFDASGKLIAHSRASMPDSVTVTEQDWFVAHQSMTPNALFISRPFQTGPDLDDWCLILSRRMTGPNGEFAGVVAAQMKLSYFRNLLRGLDVGPDGNISLVSTDGILLIQDPANHKTYIGQDLSHAPNFIRFLNERYGSFIAMSGLYHVERLYNFSQVHELPIVVVVALSTDTIFSNWRHTALLIGTATLLLCLGLVWLTGLLLRELRLRQLAERELAGLAAADPLTGLANRRTLDRHLDREWRRAQRAGTPLSLLMIDIDHFKAFNDAYGHQAGDVAIRRVAQLIKNHLHRPTDLAARYGGEEFAVVLSETGPAGAHQVAERIRLAVEAMEPVLPNAQKLTISLGTCSRYTAPGDDQEALIRTADNALYQAKKSGRNQVVSIDETPGAEPVSEPVNR